MLQIPTSGLREVLAAQLRGDPSQLGAGARQRRALTPQTVRDEAAPFTILFISGVDVNGSPERDRREFGQLKVGRQHADDSDWLAIQHDSAADHVGRAHRTAFATFHTKEWRRCSPGRGDPTARTDGRARGEPRAPETGRASRCRRSRARSPRQWIDGTATSDRFRWPRWSSSAWRCLDVRRGNAAPVCGRTGILLANRHQAIGVGERQRTQDDAIDDPVDCRRGAHADRQREDRGRAEGEMRAEAAESVTKIGEEVLHGRILQSIKLQGNRDCATTQLTAGTSAIVRRGPRTLTHRKVLSRPRLSQ